MNYLPQAVRLVTLGLGALALQSCEFSDNPYAHSGHGSGYYASAPYSSGGVYVAPAQEYRRDDYNQQYNGDGRYDHDGRYDRGSRDDRNGQENERQNYQQNYQQNNSSHQQQTVNSHQQQAAVSTHQSVHKSAPKPASKAKPNHTPQRQAPKDQPPG